MPTRSCIVCRKKDEKSNLLRIVKNENKEAILDSTQKINSRAIYLCKDKKCLEKFIALKEKGKIKLNFDIDLNSLERLIREKIV